MEQILGPITTATSQSDGRLKVGVSSSYNKKKKDSVKSIVKKYKKDGRGGSGNVNAVNSPLEKSDATNSVDMSSYPTPANSYVPMANSAPTLTESGKTTGYRMARSLKLKGINKLQSSISGINKKLKLGKGR